MNAKRTDRTGRPPFGFRFVAPLALGSVLNPINSTMLTTALVPIADSLNTSVAETGWLIAGLYMTSAVAQPTMGRLADLFGPRRIYLLSLLFVAAAGLLGLWASTLNELVVVRVLLGIGTSGAYPTAMRMFRTQGDRIGSPPPRVAMGVLSLSAVATIAVGPLIGGLLTGAFGWHSIFTVNAPLALLVILLVLLWVPKDEPRRGSFVRLVKEVDLAGLGLFTGFLLGLMTFLMNLGHPLWWALAAAAVFGAVLCVHSLRRKQPFIDVRMLVRNRPLTVTYLRVFVVTMITYTVMYGLAQWLESSVGLSTAMAGVITLPMSVVAAVSSVTGVRTKGLRAPFIISIGAALGGCLCMFFVDSLTAVWVIALAFVLFGIPQGMFSTASQAAIYLQAPAEEIGAASGLQRTAAYIGAIVAASLLASMYGHRATDHGLHQLALILGTASALLFIATLFDRTIPRVVSAVPASEK
jgi:MFS family permease